MDNLTDEERKTLVAQGQLNPETNEPWQHPDFVYKHQEFLARLIYTDLPRGWDNEDDQSWFYRYWSKDLDEKKLYKPEIAQVDPVCISRNDTLMLRLCEYWELRKHEFDTVKDNVWAKNTFLADNIKILNATLGQKNLELGHILFSNLHSSTLCEGMQQGYQAEFWLRNFRSMMPKFVKLIQDRIISLAEYVGAVSVQCPEQGGQPFYIDLDEIMEATGKKIKDRVGAVGFPIYQGGLIGIKTRAGIIDERQISSLYLALKIHEKFQHNKMAKICDLGAGNGLILFWLYQMGYRNLYAVDLPHVSLMQAWNLAIHFGNTQVRFGHEETGPINILSMDQFLEHDFDLVVNSDSLPEIDHEWAAKYLEHMNRKVKNFYSINQETMHKEQININLTIERNYHNLQSVSRHRFFMRPGYIEEWYESKIA